MLTYHLTTRNQLLRKATPPAGDAEIAQLASADGLPTPIPPRTGDTIDESRSTDPSDPRFVNCVTRFPAIRGTEIDGLTNANEAPGPASDPRRSHRAPTPAESIIGTCRKHGVGLAIDGDDLVVGGSGTQPWPSLLMAIEAHRVAVAALVAQGEARPDGWGPNDATHPGRRFPLEMKPGRRT
jgi:hypothetical protein